MDFGFSGLVEKFEEFFGTTATKVLLGIIGLTVVIACITFIHKVLISPLMAVYLNASPEESLTSVVGWLVAAAVGILGGICAAVFALWAWGKDRFLPRSFKGKMRELQEKEDRLDLMLEETKAILSKAEKERSQIDQSGQNLS